MSAHHIDFQVKGAGGDYRPGQEVTLALAVDGKIVRLSGEVHAVYSYGDVTVRVTATSWTIFP